MNFLKPSNCNLFIGYDNNIYNKEGFYRGIACEKKCKFP